MAVRSQLVAVARSLWSNSPHHGARIVAMILNNPSLLQEWSVSIYTTCWNYKFSKISPEPFKLVLTSLRPILQTLTPLESSQLSRLTYQ